MKIEFIGAAHEVTGSCHYLEIGDRKIIVDCGMEQGADLYENQEIPVAPGQLDYIFVTHAHIDHSGLIPLMFKKGFKGQVYATNATTKLCNIMLKDSAHIQEAEAEWKNRKARRAGEPEVVPMYTVADAEYAMNYFVGCPYDTEIKICDEITIRFRDAGHLLGSSFIEIWATEGEVTKKLIFSGDLGNGHRPLIKDPEKPDEADYLIIESTYGDRSHETPPDYAVALANVLRNTFLKGGNVVIPAFSVGRTQEMLYHLRRIKTENMLPASLIDFDVYVDSPLSVEATSIFNKSVAECYREEDLELIESGVNPIAFPGLKCSVTSDDSRAINFIQKPIVILSASGMCEAGRIRHHLKHNLWRKECTILFVGYQSPGTLGHSLLNGTKTVKLFGEQINVEATILNLPGISGHADREHLIAWAKAMTKKPERIFVVHGQDQVTDYLAEQMEKATGAKAYAPYSGDCFDLIHNVQIESGSRRKVEKKPMTPSGKARSIYDRLVAAGERLIAVISRNKGGTNKDLSKFADQINALCDKWDR